MRVYAATMAAFVAVVFIAPGAVMAEAQQTKTYIGSGAGVNWAVLPLEDPTLLLDEDNCCHCVSQTFTGGVVFCNEEGWSGEVDIEIADDSGMDTAAIVNGTPICGSHTVDVGDTTEVTVIIGDLDDPACGQGTTGQVSISPA